MLFCYCLGIVTGGLAVAAGRSLQRYISIEVRHNIAGRFLVIQVWRALFLLKLKEAQV